MGRKRFAVKHSSEKVLSKLMRSPQIKISYSSNQLGVRMTRF